MQRIDGPTVSAALPVPAPVGTGSRAPGYFQGGNPLAGTAPTTLNVDWANMVQEEICAVVENAGIALDKTNHGQLLAALAALFVAKGGGSDFVIGPNEFSLPLGGGMILKGGSVAGSFNEGSTAVFFAASFPNACFVAIPVAVNNTGSTGRDIWAQRGAKSAAGFAVTLQSSSSTGAVDGFDWIAVGN